MPFSETTRCFANIWRFWNKICETTRCFEKQRVVSHQRKSFRETCIFFRYSAFWLWKMANCRIYTFKSVTSITLECINPVSLLTCRFLQTYSNISKKISFSWIDFVLFETTRCFSKQRVVLEKGINQIMTSICTTGVCRSRTPEKIP